MIGYPARDPYFPDPDVMDRIFNHRYDKKRLAPGLITGTAVDRLYHDCSTLGGNSGGVVVNTRGEAVSLVSYGYGIYTQTVPIDRAQTVAAEIERRAELIGRCKAQADGAACG